MIEQNETAGSNVPANQREHMDVQRLALRPKEAAASLGIGERLLWSMTNQNLIPHLKIGRAVVYPVSLLQQWLESQSKTR
jgi:excisionase family DNA binding protein